jgi:transitional endoplasmic reticulum ATPase
VFLGLPDVEARRAMLDINDVPLAEDVDLDELATLTEGLSFADIAGLLREAALAALRSDGSATMVRREHLDAALAHVRAQRQGDGAEDPPGGAGDPPPLGA